VPKDPEKNAQWRLWALDQAENDPQFAAETAQMCAEDILFFVNGWAWILEPRDPYMPDRPFITFPKQDEAFLTLVDNLGSRHVVFEKSRCQGATWICLTFFDHRILFYEQNHFVICSQTADLVETPNDPRALFTKIDYLHEHLPAFLQPDIVQAKMRRYNQRTRSGIVGAATTDDIGRSGRTLSTFVDELAAFRPNMSWAVKGALATVTETTIACSTHRGTQGAFYHMSQNPLHAKVRMHWSENPMQNEGLYTFRDGQLDIIDKDYEFPEGYAFVATDVHGNPLNGRPRSPYYDKVVAEDLEGMAYLAAQEMDIDPQGSSNQFFPQPLLAKHADEYAIQPIAIGELGYDDEGQPDRFEESPSGHLWLWLNLDADGNPPKGRTYAIGADVAMGTGASNSTFVVADEVTREKVAEFASPFLRPSYFAAQVRAAQLWFNNARLIWDATGSAGKSFSREYLELGGEHFYYRETNTEDPVTGLTNKPGFVFAPGLKVMEFGAYATALRRGTYVNRSERALDEASQFVNTSNGGVEHAASQGTTDRTGATTNHGDICTADVLLNRLLGKVDVSAGPGGAERGPPPHGSIAYYMAKDEAENNDGAWLR
jgi:hypothetical protein